MQTSNSNGSETPLAPSVSPEPQPLESEDDDETLSEIIMAVDLQRKDTAGCCYYVARDEKLYFMEEMKLGGVPAIDARAYSPMQSRNCVNLSHYS